MLIKYDSITPFDCLRSKGGKNLLTEILKKLDFVDRVNLAYSCKFFWKILSRALNLKFIPIKHPYYLFPYQINAIKWMIDREKDEKYGIRGGILGFEMGLGKTLTASSHCLMQYKSSQTPTLIIVSKTIMGEWLNFKNKFYPNINIIFFHKEYIHESSLNEGSIKNMDDLRPQDLVGVHFFITTYDVIKSSCSSDILDKCAEKNKNGTTKKYHIPTEPSNIKKLGKNIIYTTRWERIITDESQLFSNVKTSIYKSLMCICSDKRWCLSGTPIRNNEFDMYALMTFLGYDGCEKKNWSQDIYLSHDLDEVSIYLDYQTAGVEMPNKKEHEIYLNPSKEEKDCHDYFMGKAQDDYQNMLRGQTTYVNVLARFTRLRQVCSVPYLASKDSIFDKSKEKGSGGYEWLSDIEKSGYECAKIKKILEIMSKDESKFIIFSNFKESLDVLSTCLTKKNIRYTQLDGSIKGDEREANLNSFKNRQRIRVLLMTYKTGSEGLNLTCATNIICMDPWWNQTTEDQAIHRSWRLGQKEEVNIYRLLIKNSLEEDIVQMIWGKKNEIRDNFMTNSRSEAPSKTGMNKKMMGKILGFN